MLITVDSGHLFLYIYVPEHYMINHIFCTSRWMFSLGDHLDNNLSLYNYDIQIKGCRYKPPRSHFKSDLQRLSLEQNASGLKKGHYLKISSAQDDNSLLGDFYTIVLNFTDLIKHALKLSKQYFNLCFILYVWLNPIFEQISK